MLRRLLLSTILIVVLTLSKTAHVNTQANWPDGHYAIANLTEITLTTTNVNTTEFGKLVFYTVDGAVSAQPVYVKDVTINGVSRNLLYVATMKRKLYAFDADSLSSTPLWIGEIGASVAADQARQRTPVSWNSPGDGPLTYAWAENDVLKAYRLSAGRVTTPAYMNGGVLSGRDGGGALALSANGSTTGTGIVWASMPMGDEAILGEGAGILRAFDAESLREIWTSEQNAARDRAGRLPKFVAPVVANGRVYMPTVDGRVVVYGLLPLSIPRPLDIVDMAGSRAIPQEPGSLANGGIDVSTDAGAIGIDFVGNSTTRMTSAESAGVVPKPNWNSAIGAVSATALALVDEAGTLTSAAVTWSANNGWVTPIADSAGNARMMKGYLDTSSTSTTTVTVTGLPQRPYDVYVYVDGDNRVYERSAAYMISGAGIATTSVNVIDAANANFANVFTRGDNSKGNYVKFTVIATGFTLSARPVAPTSGTRRAPVNGIQIVPSASAPVPSGIGITFAGASTVTMAATESAGVVPRKNWNNAAGAARSTPLPLVSDAGAATTASVTWTANSGGMTPIVDQPGNARLMKGYVDTSGTSVTTVTVVALPQAAYDIYVYVDGDNGDITRTSTYRITGPGITAAPVNLTDQANTDFAGTFVEAAGTSGNYVKFRINSNGFTLTATPGTSTNGIVRAPVNAIQIIAVSPTPAISLNP